MQYNWLIAFVILLFIVAVMACIFCNAGCPIIITGDWGLRAVEERNHVVVNGQVAGVRRNPIVDNNLGAAAVMARPSPINNGPIILDEESVVRPDSVTEPFATTVTPCNW